MYVNRNMKKVVDKAIRTCDAPSVHGKSASKKSFDQLAAEKGIKTFRKA